MQKSVELRYGVNPHQTPARIVAGGELLPLKIISGAPGYINLLDALNGWQLVSELRQALDLPAAASFKHVSPAGAAVSVALDERLQQATFAGDRPLSPLASAYARARGADRISSFGDWAAFSDPVDGDSARLLRREVSDGVIAPGYTAEALAILQKKKKGAYRIIEIDRDYKPDLHERRDLFGITFEQRRNDWTPSPADLQNVVTRKQGLSDADRRDMIVALITLKYTQSNSVCFVKDGQTIGIGAGQQSRIHCTRLAASKAANWWLRQHPRVLALPFRDKIGRPERDNAVDQYLQPSLTAAERRYWLQSFSAEPQPLSAAAQAAWLAELNEVTLGSDAFFPFRDSIDCATTVGTERVVQPGGSIRDDVVIEACDAYGIAMAFCGTRLFHH